MGEWVVGGSLSARTVEEEAEADGQRFVAEEVAEESPVRIGTSLGVWAASLICGLGERQGGEGLSMAWVAYR